MVRILGGWSTHWLLYTQLQSDQGWEYLLGSHIEVDILEIISIGMVSLFHGISIFMGYCCGLEAPEMNNSKRCKVYSSIYLRKYRQQRLPVTDETRLARLSSHSLQGGTIKLSP